jgi:uncharacterized protein
MEKNYLIKLIIITLAMSLTSCSSMKFPTFSTPNANTTVQASHSDNTNLWSGNASDVWEKLQRISSARLISMQSNSADPTQKAWLDLALISKRNSLNTPLLAQNLLAWRARNPNHPANQLLPNTNALIRLENNPEPRQIGVLLPHRGTYSSLGKAVREGILNAYYSGKPPRQGIRFYDTTQASSMGALYQQAIADGADFVIGPLTKADVQQLQNTAPFAAITLALNYTAGTLPARFYEFGLLPEDETEQLATRAHQAGASHAIIIAPKNGWGDRVVNAFSTRWQNVGGNIQETWQYPVNADFNQGIAQLLKANVNADKTLTKTELEKQRRQDVDVIFLFAQPQEARTIVPLLRYYYANSIPIYSISAVYSGKPNPAKDADLNGVIVCDIPWNMRRNASDQNDEVQYDRLYAVGQDSYLLTKILYRLVALPNFPIYGTTGALTLAGNQQIHRRIPCVPIRDGRL